MPLQVNKSTKALDSSGAQTIMTYPTLHDVPFPLRRDGVAARTSLLGWSSKGGGTGDPEGQKDRVKWTWCFCRRWMISL
jgi:hypothetical protein